MSDLSEYIGTIVHTLFFFLRGTIVHTHKILDISHLCILILYVHAFILERIRWRSCMQGKLCMRVLFGNKCIRANFGREIISYMEKSCMQNLMHLDPRSINERPARCPGTQVPQLYIYIRILAYLHIIKELSLAQWGEGMDVKSHHPNSSFLLLDGVFSSLNKRHLVPPRYSHNLIYVLHSQGQIGYQICFPHKWHFFNVVCIVCIYIIILQYFFFCIISFYHLNSLKFEFQLDSRSFIMFVYI